jgi:hypothetical protein
LTGRGDGKKGASVDMARSELVEVLRVARALLGDPGNNFFWSPWKGAEEALREMDSFIQAVEVGSLPDRLDLAVLFAPTGAIQEVAVSSSWGDEFLTLAARFDAAEARVYGIPPG